MTIPTKALRIIIRTIVRCVDFYFIAGGVIMDIEILKEQIIRIINGLVAYDLLDFIYKLLIYSGEHTQDSAELGRGELVEH